jgi:hypothetical protein
MIECTRLGGLFGRFASLWNSYLMGGLMKYRALRPLGSLGVALANLICYGLDRLAPHPRLASDYLAVLALRDEATEDTHAAARSGD